MPISETMTTAAPAPILPAPEVKAAEPPAVTTPPAGVWTADDSAQTRKSDKDTRNASFLGGATTH